MTSKIDHTEKTESAKRGRGRPPTLDREAALDAAMTLFWEHGYEGTSFDELTSAMKISCSSFYNSFGSKEKLYAEAVERYLRMSSEWSDAILSDASLDTKAAFNRLVEEMAARITSSDCPRGCMIALAAAHFAPALKGIHDLMADHRARSELRMEKRIREGVAKGDVPTHTDAKILAAYFATALGGLSVQARDGANRKELVSIAHLVMRAWPSD